MISTKMLSLATALILILHVLHQAASEDICDKKCPIGYDLYEWIEYYSQAYGAIVCARESAVVGAYDCSTFPPCINPVTHKQLPRVDILNERIGKDFFHCQCARLVKEKPCQVHNDYFRNYYYSRSLF